MRQVTFGLVVVCPLMAAWRTPVCGQEFLLPPVGPAAVYAPPWRPLPFSRHPQVRQRQELARQLAVLEWTRWHADVRRHYGAEEVWLFGPPLTFAWEFPPVEQPIGQRRVYDGRGGYSSFPVYADEIAPPPVPQRTLAEEPAIGRRPVREAAPSPPAADAVVARRLFSW